MKVARKPRTVVFHFRATNAEAERIARKASQKQVSISDYLREVVIGK